MSDNKSGYEIRADLLNMAQGILSDNYHRKVDAIHVHNASYPNDIKALPSQSITAADVISVANELSEFVLSLIHI